MQMTFLDIPEHRSEVSYGPHAVLGRIVVTRFEVAQLNSQPTQFAERNHVAFARRDGTDLAYLTHLAHL